VNTIRQQLTRRLLLTVALLLAAGAVAVYWCARTALLAQFDAALRAKAQAITSLTEQKGDHIELDFADETMRGFESHSGPDFFQLWRADGKVVERSRSLGRGDLPLRYGPAQTPLFWNLTLPGGQPGRAVGLRFQPQQGGGKRRGGPVMEAVLVVASQRRDLDRTLATLALVLGGSGVLLLAATALVVPGVLRRGLSPLQQLADATARIDAGSLTARFPTRHLPGELVPIVARLNELLDRLQDAFERERRFSADVAHEFRTPVAELRSLAELSVKLPDARPANADQEVLAIALHLESILTRLLALARAERGQLQVQRQPVRLAALVQEVCGSFQPKAAGRQITMHWRVPADATAQTDPVLLRSILTNLVDNAVTYSPTGSVVEVEADAANGQFSLRVVNTADQLEETDLPRLFERFWRKDAARTTDGHTGLGLALARAFAQVLDCELTATFIQPRRLALTLRQKEDVRAGS
jgi:signal transduction histidine kinase